MSSVFVCVLSARRLNSKAITERSAASQKMLNAIFWMTHTGACVPACVCVGSVSRLCLCVFACLLRTVADAVLGPVTMCGFTPENERNSAPSVTLRFCVRSLSDGARGCVCCPLTVCVCGGGALFPQVVVVAEQAPSACLLRSVFSGAL